MTTPDFSFLERRLAQLEQHVPAPLKSGSGDGTSGGMEARMAKVEAALDHVGRELTDIKAEVRTLRTDQRSDFRMHFGALIFVALGLAGLMAKGFKWF